MSLGGILLETSLGVISGGLSLENNQLLSNSAYACVFSKAENWGRFHEPPGVDGLYIRR